MDSRILGFTETLSVLLLCAAFAALPLLASWTGSYGLSALVVLAAVYLPLVVAHWPRAAELAVIALVLTPIMAVVPQVGSAYVVLAAALLLLVGFVGVTESRRLRALPILAFVCWQFLSALHGVLPVYRSTGAWSLLVLPTALIGIYLILQRGSHRVDRALLGTLVVVGVVESVMAISQSMWGHPVFALAGAPEFELPRSYLSVFISSVNPWVRLSTGTFEHFNGLGAYLCMVVPVCFWWWLRSHQPLRLALLVLTSMGLVLSFSRGALIGAGFGCLLVYALLAPPRTRLAKTVLVVVVVLVAAVAMRDGVGAYFRSTNSLGSRENVWRLATDRYGDDAGDVLFGSGAGTVQRALERMGADTRTVHSGPLQMLLETGIVGSGLFVYAVAYSYRRGRREVGGRSIVYAGALGAFLIATLADNSMSGYMGVIWLGLLVAMAVSPEGQHAQSMHVRTALLGDAGLVPVGGHSGRWRGGGSSR